MGRRSLAAALILCLLCSVLRVGAEETVDYRDDLLGYYAYYQTDASREIADCLDTLEAQDPEQGALWRKIMAGWEKCNTSSYNTCRALHDGLPQDDSLCIVVFGYALKADGTMQPELIDRLNTALNAARQYPRAYVAVTGGATSADVGEATEAGQMAQWLRSNGVAGHRLILETQALSTTENARNVYELLIRQYPQVQQVVAVTSDYHVTFAASVLQAVSDYRSATEGTPEITVAAGISCATATPDRDMMTSQARSIGIITGVDWSGERPELTYGEPETTQQTEPPALPETAQAPEEPERSLLEKLFGWLHRK